ncbi:MAG: Tfp pilus assembly protein FimT/FimU [Pyrinomonadaceae bacterium]
MRNEKLKARGFSMLELLIVMVIIAIVSAFAVMGITRSRNTARLQNSARIFAGYVEKARLDAIRRHDATNIDITGPSTYAVTMDFDGTTPPGTALPVRTFQLEKGVVFTDSTGAAFTVNASGDVVGSSTSEIPPSADFNWRGRTTECSMLFRMKNSNSTQSAVQVAGSGDITIDSDVSTPAALTYTNVNSTSDISSSAVVTGGGTHLGVNPCGTAGGGGTPPSSTAPCGTMFSDLPVPIRRNGGSTTTVNITVSSIGTLTATPNSNLSVTPATRNVTASGTYSFTIASITRTRGTFPVVFSNPCTSVTVYVKVGN